MIFIACDQLANHLRMMLFSPKLFPRFMRPTTTAKESKVQMQSHRRHLIDHYQSFTVCQTHELFRIGIMRGAEGVGANPFEQIEVFHIECFIQSAPVDMGVLMSAKALKIKRLPIDQEFPVPDLDRPHAERFLIRIDTLPIFPQFHSTRIQIGVPGLPEMHICDGEVAGRSAAAGNSFTGLVVNGDANLSFSLGLDGVSYPRIRSLDLRRQSDIAYIGGRGGIEFDRSLDGCIVEKVKVRGIRENLPLAWNVFILIIVT